MMFPIPGLFRTTTFKLALVHTAVFAVFVVGLLIYLYTSTVVFVRSEAAASLEAEFSELLTVYERGDLGQLSRSVRERSSASMPGTRQFLYLLQDADGEKIGGQLAGLQVSDETVSKKLFIDIEYPKPDGSFEARPSEGRFARLEDGVILFIAYDIDEFLGVLPRITRVVWTAAPIGLLMSLLGGIIVSRSAARRADELANTAKAVMGGDFSRRVPVDGSGDEFDRLGEQLNAMLERIEQLMQSSRHIGDAIAHDLRSPITRLRNRLETALSTPLSHHDAEDALGHTLNEVDAVLATFNAILRLSRLEAGEAARMVPTDITALMLELGELYEPACEAAGLEFSSDIGRALTVKGDRSMIAQALSNLIDNAIKYTPPPGQIRLEAAKARDNKVVIRVIDTGPGIPEGDRESVMKRFVRLEVSRSEPGSGLGLSLVKAVADIHKGEFEFSDGGGGADRAGLVASLRLPRG